MLMFGRFDGRNRQSSATSSRASRGSSNWPMLCIAFLLALVVLLAVVCLVLAFYKFRPEPKNKLEAPRLPYAIPSHQEKYHRDMVERINRAETSWTAVYNKFASETIQNPPKESLTAQQEANYQNWGNRIWAEDKKMGTTDNHIRELLASETPIPAAFDARLRWPNCASLYRIPNQGGCGSCWAIAASTVISDRICIHSNGSQQPEISTEDILTCAKPSGGCTGGDSYVAFWTWVKKGLVTGGPYGSNEGCRPYSIPNDCGTPCHWFYWTYSSTPSCKTDCQPIYQKKYAQDKYYGSVVYSVTGLNKTTYNETIRKLIQQEIETFGPVEVCLHVHEDLQHYHSGVYRHVTGQYLYGHCIRLLGWGETEDKVPYWIAVNSFGRNWGQNGIFWLLRNYTLTSVTAGLP